MSIVDIATVVGLALLFVVNIVTMLRQHRKSGEAYGCLQQKVEHVSEALNGKEGNGGLVNKVDGISIHLATLEGECKTIFPIILSKLDGLNGKGKKSHTKTKSSR